MFLPIFVTTWLSLTLPMQPITLPAKPVRPSCLGPLLQHQRWVIMSFHQNLVEPAVPLKCR